MVWYTNSYLGDLVGQLYVDRFFDKKSKRKVQDMVDQGAQRIRQQKTKTNEKRGLCVGRAPFSESMFGCVLLSHTVTSAVPSALKGLASGFGMGPGVSPSL